jgi:hypothetical protein
MRGGSGATHGEAKGTSSLKQAMWSMRESGRSAKHEWASAACS